MKTLTSAPAFLLCGALALMAGCASEPESHVVSAPPPGAPTMVVAGTATTPQPVVVTTQGTATAPGSNTIIVTQAPPAPQPVAEVAVARPSSQHVWVDGYYTWRNNRYEWMAGHWEVPPRAGAVWVAPKYEREGSGYRFYEGYWN